MGLDVRKPVLGVPTKKCSTQSVQLQRYSSFACSKWGHNKSQKVNRKAADQTAQMGSVGAQWVSGRVHDSRPRGRRFESRRCHCLCVFELEY